MEVPRIWREIPQNTGFRAQIKDLDVDSGERVAVFKYPGGSIAFDGTMDDLGEKLMDRGFSELALEKILSTFFDRVSPETSVSLGEVVEGFLELQGSEVGK